MQNNITSDVQTSQNHCRENAESLLSSTRETRLARQENAVEEKREEYFPCKALAVCGRTEPSQDSAQNCGILTRDLITMDSMDTQTKSSKSRLLINRTLQSKSLSCNCQPVHKLLRRLTSENDPTTALELCKQLEIAVLSHFNIPYIRRSFDYIAETIIAILKRGPEECCLHLAKIFGLVGYVHRMNFRIYKNWIINSYKSSINLKIYLMHSLKVTLSCDSVNLSLTEYSDQLIILLKQYLERADTADTFIAVSNAIVEFSNNYKESFEKQFTDVVDIIVGWHLEFDQTRKFKKHCSEVLQHFSEFFLLNVDFTFSLMTQIIEDIKLSFDKNKQNEIAAGSFIDTLNSIIKSLVTNSEVCIFRLSNKMMTDALFTIETVAKHCFESSISLLTINSINEFFSIFVCNQDPLLIDINGIQQIILIELIKLESFEEDSIQTLLFLILVLVYKLKTQMTVDFISIIVDPNGPLAVCKMRKNEKIFKLLMKIYHEILLIKNVAILQEVYKNILIDIRQNIKRISNSSDQSSNYIIFQAECILNFYIAALSVLATQTSSIMAMYALNPSILVLLIDECKLKNLNFWSSNPCLYRSLLSLLLTHCKKNHNYILSSNLLKDNFFSKMSLDDTSPTSGNFEIILNFIAEVLAISKELCCDNLCSLLDWTRQIIMDCREYSYLLKDNQNFNKIAKNICAASIERPMECAECISELQNFQHINIIVQEFIKSACCFNITSTKKKVRDKYTLIYAKLPLNVSLNSSKILQDPFQLKDQQKRDLQQWYMSTGVPSNIKHKYFKRFIESVSIENCTNFMDEFLKDMVRECWVHQNSAHNVDLFKLVTTNLNMLISWAQWELAQYCVNNKLRTSLGNPQETFLKIEGIVKEYARILALKETSKTKTAKNLMVHQKHANILLGFLEYLEKAVYNAANGTAFALPSPGKPAKTFFYVNIPTCNEWFNRIRGAVNLVGLHAMESEMVIRYSEIILKNLISNDRNNDILLEHTLTSFAWALLRCGESEALHGLYTWVKLKTGKKFNLLRHAAEHAAGHREKAADGYRLILNSKEEKIDNHIREFSLILLIDCLYYTNQWKELHTLINLEESTVSSNRETMLLVSLTKHERKIIENLEESSDLEPILDLNEWDLFDSAEIDNNFSYHKIVNKTEETLISLIINGKLGIDENFQTKLNICSEITNAGLQECLRLQSGEHLHIFVILNHIVQKLKSNEDLNDITIDAVHSPETLTKILRWSELFNYTRNGRINFNLLLNIASLARKNENLNYCKSQLTQFFRHKDVGIDLNDISSRVLSGELIPNINDKFLIQGYSELSKWLFEQNGKQNDGINLVANCCSQGVKQKLDNNLGTETSEGISRMMLTLAEWLASHTEIDNLEHVQHLLSNLDNISDTNYFSSNQVISNNETAIGKILHYSVVNTPSSSRSWSALGNWCYRWGKKMVEAKYYMNADKAGLTESDIEAIKSSIPNATQQDIENIVSILNKHQVTAADDEEIGSNEISSTELIENQLRRIEILSGTSSEVIPSIIEIWRQAYKSVYNYYEMAADAYFKYLNLTSSSDINSSSGIDRESKTQANCSIVTATLRLLRLVVKHALGLQEVLEEGLSKTPTRPWKVIIPQLFSRLNHHETYVRDRVSELLCRVAKDSPHLIIFPAVVGAVQEDKIEENAIEANPLTFCFNSLLSTLSKQTPETVKQVHLLVRELKRVTLLWEEYWVHSLAQLYNEYSELFNSFEADIKKSTEQKHEILYKKYDILMSHVADDVKRLHCVTSRPPETNYEQIFQDKYTKVIETTISDLQKPLNLSKPNESWLKIKQLYSIFQQKIQKNSQAVLKMIDISPVLANMKNTAISMPGVETDENNPIFITSVDSIVYILPTKTKPKKLAFLGSNGKKYTYLFKGLEDLHLDERIMQFLSISNSMMRKDDGGAKYTAHHYSVIPLGPRSGLISWVDGVTPMFGLYKKWQHREAANVKKDKEKQTAVVRPSEMFYAKLTPLLAKHNIKTTDVRKSWPLAVLKKVLEELTKETPRDLFAKELWCHSSNCASWRQAIRTYSRSVAVMSVIGYVIGLGDRHLDNVLVKLTTGEIVHIDYNVCFEKGQTLRVPEKVPFRMTQNLEEALGVTGVEGTFRLTCEYVLKTLRKERETLLTLLEAFVYDPLVDWAVSDDGTSTNTRNTKALVAAADIAALCVATSANIKNNTFDGLIDGDRLHLKKKMEDEVMRNTLVTRFAEIKPDWTQYRNDVNDRLSEIIMYLDNLNENRLEIEKDESERDLITKQLALIREVQILGTAMSSHPLNSISQRYAAYQVGNEKFLRLKELLVVYHQEIEGKKNFFTSTLLDNETDLRTEEIIEKLNVICKQEIENEFEYVKEFLESCSQDQLYNEGNQARIEMNASLLQQAYIIELASESLTQYFSIMRYYPKSLLRNHRYFKYDKWCKELLANPDASSTVINDHIEYQTNQYSIQLNEINEEDAIGYAIELEKLWLDTNFKVRNSLDSLRDKNVDSANKLYMETKKGIQIFKQVDLCASAALNISLVIKINELIKELIQFEESCRRSTNGFWQLPLSVDNISDKESNFFECLIELTTIAFENDTAIFSQLSVYIEGLKQLKSNLDEIKLMEIMLSTDLTFKIVEMMMLDDDIINYNLDKIIAIDDVTDLRIVFNKLQSGVDCTQDIETIQYYYAEVIESISKNLKCVTVFNTVDETFKNITTKLDDSLKSVQNLINNSRFSLKDNLKINLLEKYSSTSFIAQMEIKKLQMLSQIVVTTKTMVKSFKENDINLVLNSRLISNPIYRCVNDFILLRLLGQGSIMALLLQNELGNICSIDLGSKALITNTVSHNSIVEEKIQLMEFSLQSYNSAECLCQRLLDSICNKMSAETLKQTIAVETKILKHLSLISTVHFWINDQLHAMGNTKFGHIIYKHNLLKNIQSAIQHLSAWKISIEKITREITEYTLAVIKRLKWSVGANQNLLNLQETFLECIAAQENRLKANSEISQEILGYCLSVVSFEMLQNNGRESLDSDEQFANLVEQWLKTYSTKSFVSSTIDSIEKSIVELLDPEGDIEHGWLNNILGLLEELYTSVQNKIADHEKNLTRTQDNLQMCAIRLQSMTNLSQLRMDVRYLLKLIIKIESSCNIFSGRPKQFQLYYRLFLSKLDDINSKIISRDYTEANVKEIRESINDLLWELQEIYEDFIQLANDRSGNLSEQSVESRDKNEPKKSNTPIREMKKGNMPEQKRNAYAVSVWRRIRMKLEGRDPDPNRRFTVAEQVDWMIREAINPDNLAVLYEGWTPWV